MIARRGGGALETIVDGVTGCLWSGGADDLRRGRPRLRRCAPSIPQPACATPQRFDAASFRRGCGRGRGRVRRGASRRLGPERQPLASTRADPARRRRCPPALTPAPGSGGRSCSPRCALLLRRADRAGLLHRRLLHAARVWAGLGAWVLVAVWRLIVCPRPAAGPRAAGAGLGALLAARGLDAGLDRLGADRGQRVPRRADRRALRRRLCSRPPRSCATARDAARVEPALAGGTLIVIGYGISERLLPGLLHFARSVSAQGRLEQPLTYWNAMGELAALGFVLAARLAGDASARGRCGSAAAATAPLGLGAYLSVSRGALFACAAGLVALVVLAPQRAQLDGILVPWRPAGGLAGGGAVQGRDLAGRVAVDARATGRDHARRARRGDGGRGGRPTAADPARARRAAQASPPGAADGAGARLRGVGGGDRRGQQGATAQPAARPARPARDASEQPLRLLAGGAQGVLGRADPRGRRRRLGRVVAARTARSTKAPRTPTRWRSRRWPSWGWSGLALLLAVLGGVAWRRGRRCAPRAGRWPGGGAGRHTSPTRRWTGTGRCPP